ncbi:MAG: Smr/MutS family protein, partial [Pseudobdellovibrionaceae bacterium]
MESLDLFAPWFTRLKIKSTLKTLELKDVRHFCLETIALKEIIGPFNGPYCSYLKNTLMTAEEPLSAIEQILAPNGDIRMDASEKLYSLSKEKENLARQVQNTLDRLVHDHEMVTFIQDKYVTTREGRWVLPIRGGKQHFVQGVIHATSQTKQTVFIEPEEVVPMNNRLRQVETEIEEEIERLLVELSAYLTTLSSDFERTRECLETADVKLSIAKFATLIEATPCEFSENVIALKEVKHPLLVLNAKANQKGIVSNNVELDPKAHGILLLSGPNAGGKTVLLKAVGLAAHMARCGIPICAAEGSKLPFFEKIHIAVGDSQSVDENLSTFAAHLKVLGEATTAKGPKTLLLIDEICGSTDPEEGSALARSFIETYARNQVLGVITSHLGPLKTGWNEKSGVINGSLEYDRESGRPTYQFLMGIPGESLAIQTAKRVGVPTQIVERAIDALSPATRTKLEALQEIEQLKSEIQHLRLNLDSELKQTEKKRKEYEKLKADFEREKESLLSKELKKAQTKVEEMIAQAKVENVFKKHTALQEIKMELPEIIKAPAGPVFSQGLQSADEFTKRFPPGTKIFVPSLSRDGVVQSEPNNKGEVLVMAGSIRMYLPWQDLKPPQKADNPTAHAVRRATPFSVALHETDRTLDLRGKTVDAAIEELESILDQASTHKEDRIKVIHGHGTEVLKRAVRTYLSRSMYVKKWKAGAPDQGGDGMTWVELNRE